MLFVCTTQTAFNDWKKSLEVGSSSTAAVIGRTVAGEENLYSVKKIKLGKDVEFRGFPASLADRKPNDSVFYEYVDSKQGICEVKMLDLPETISDRGLLLKFLEEKYI